jgi:DNA-binding CsgD family transcriptional regulator
VNLAATADAPAAGVLIFDAARRPSAWTDGALSWLEASALGPDHACVVDGLLEQLVALELEDGGSPTARTTFRAGERWIVAQAMRLADGGIVVSIDPLPADRVIEFLARRYGLTGREREIVDLLAHGLDTEGVTQTLSISRYTLQDHLKSIFRKTGVHTRLKLVALVSAAQSAKLHGP